MRKLLSIALAFLAAGIVTAVAETYPSRTITIIVPFPAGGPTDTLGRILADGMRRALGQSVIVENLTGAAGTVGTGHVAHAAPDGYTLILGHWQTHVVNGATSISVTDVSNNKTYTASVVGYDRTRDIAVLQLHNASGLQTATLGNSSNASVGQDVVGVGNAGGTGGTPSAAGGTVTASLWFMAEAGR